MTLRDYYTASYVLRMEEPLLKSQAALLFTWFCLSLHPLLEC